MIANGAFYEDLGADHFNRSGKPNQIERLAAKIQSLGYGIEIKPLAASPAARFFLVNRPMWWQLQQSCTKWRCGMPMNIRQLSFQLASRLSEAGISRGRETFRSNSSQ